MTKQIIKCNETRFTVYVWKRQLLASSKNKRVGHVSARTWVGGDKGIGYYISFWPSTTAGIFNRYGVGSRMAVSLEEDVGDEHEGTEPTQVFELYSLDIPKINALWEKYCDKNLGIRWATMASTFFMHPETINCVEMIRRLLIAGGIKKLQTYRNVAYVAAGTTLSVLGISMTASTLTPAADSPFFIPTLWKNYRYSVGIGLGFGFILAGVTITQRSKFSFGKYMAHLVNISTGAAGVFGIFATGFLKLFSLIGVIFDRSNPLRMLEGIEKNGANDVFSVCLGVAGISAAITTTMVSTFKLLDKTFITPDDMFKIVRAAEDCEKIQYELIEEERCMQTHSFDRVTL